MSYPISMDSEDIRDLYRKALSNAIPAMDEIEGDDAKPENTGENSGETGEKREFRTQYARIAQKQGVYREKPLQLSRPSSEARLLKNASVADLDGLF